jgi:hypothetical protein
VRGTKLVEHADEGLGIAVSGESELTLGGHQGLFGVAEREERAVEDAVRIEDDEPGLLRCSGHEESIGAGRWALGAWAES